MNAPNGTPLRVLIVDDHVVVRAGLRALLTGEPGFAVIAETGDGEEAVGLATRLRPDVVLMDLRLTDDTAPGARVNGLDATRRITAEAPGSRVVVLTGSATQGDVVRAMAAGARGYILKAGPSEELFRAVRAAAAGGMGLAPEAAGHLADPGTALSDREIEVVRLLALGHSNRSIAASLHLAEATIKTHLVRVYRKLGTENRASTVSEAVRRGLLELG
ncbi:response regulator transcription factor [Streptomyces sp. NBC_00391]|uniref:response regulator transcription factor n=1 Tax=Streptomyces sp. NBC_00391 TaxID=2903647 RepID=UPI002E210C5F